MIIKNKQLQCFRTSTHRDVEDWRNDKSPERNGPWAVRCLKHNVRTFFNTYLQARDKAVSPGSCPDCDAFDRRCEYCPSNRDAWLADPTAGYTKSAGHILGKSVCGYHQYGPIPERVSYRTSGGPPLDKVVVEVLLGSPAAGTKLFTVSFQNGDRRFWIGLNNHSAFMTDVSARDYHHALGFAITVAAALNEQALASADGHHSHRGFETWEAAAARLEKLYAHKS